MQFYYGEQNILRALDEAEFWKHQEAEHAGMIPEVTPNLEPQYVHKCEQFGIELGKMYAEVVKYIESITRSRGTANRELKTQMMNLIRECLEQSKSFTEFLEELLKNSHAVQASKPSQTVINHQIRESEYFIGVDQLILS